MTKISEMSDAELCEAISLLREPKPDYYIGENLYSKEANWQYVSRSIEYSYLSVVIGLRWVPINWLSPENWVRLLEEMANHGYCPALIFDDNGHWALSTDGVHQVVVGENPVDVQTTFFIDARQFCDTPGRAVCQEYLIANGGGRYE